ncbi:YqaE/Pmp3 family membrane protein [Subsaximicrobium wynnwilliamsii]|uniref:YqaE/Pmp3 family membrane protein n=1 Tax=Subsaximicrobium wynnwilliamsii TaxID=291179 RepID=A0A5C6ZMR4_9FLAO|nr:YqaE/Pmp3 family membrane protein [Subsaximicrobium wynnwilliamsii]TXD81565.1 YqaE/Pmp3 family membrane protein [Subsaximicrobium wynnwilliamsii]TXD89927.1 YqaE/Pmp3 family membrane protein [Subsaximicrobium wynnwilliamsii]TXE01026.1 YqaE/Pmp3 family membrane protein [Subsaximicrobium wynnwilliamsii]
MPVYSVVLCILFPPLAVYLNKGSGRALVFSIVLTLLLWFPGMIHALITTDN